MTVTLDDTVEDWQIKFLVEMSCELAKVSK